MNWIYRPFAQLTTDQLYDLIQLREQVFVVEQKCVYLDCDGNDRKASHLLGYKGNELVACLRTFAPGVRYPEASFGRVASSQSVRGTGVGRELTRIGIEKLLEEFPGAAIHISAQAYLEKFYASFGFRPIGVGYLEDDIPHIAMIREGLK